MRHTWAQIRRNHFPTLCAQFIESLLKFRDFFLFTFVAPSFSEIHREHAIFPLGTDGLDQSEHLFDTGCVEGWRAEQQRQQTNAWSPGQKILNSTGSRVPEHTFNQPVPIVARIVWEQDGEEHIETEAAGWSGQNVYVRLPDPRYRLTSVWLDAADVKRR
jgi:hypothetical protein